MLDNLINGAKFLFENKQFKDAATVLNIVSKFIQDKFVLDKIYENLRMCYFFANDVPAALAVLEMQEKLQITKGWEIKRDKANYLRYVNRHEDSYNTVLEISDANTKNLALSWFEHKKGNVRKAFSLTEKSRQDNYWWKKRPGYNFKLWDGSKVDNLVIVEESGFGDQIIFSRWISNVKNLCDNLYYDGNGLTETFVRNFDIKPVNLIENDSGIHAIPIMSLAYVLNIDSSSHDVYLTANKNLVKGYNERYPKIVPRIGLCVQGEKKHLETTLRTLPIRQLIESLKDLGEIVNLQKEIDEYCVEINYIPFNSWEDTLALIDTCDIIVTCDTSISHAAGALGKCTIVLMHSAAYFTWNHNQDISKSLWYNNAWCIHQDIPCDWTASIQKCKNLINELLIENYKIGEK